MTDLRKCIGSAKFGIEAHEAPVADFPVQPSQKSGLGRLCKPHWSQYTSALRKAALARKAAERGVAESEPAPVAAPKGAAGRTAKKARVTKPEPIRTRVPRGRKQVAPEAAPQGDAG